jgi:hypothetical protein
MSFRTRLTGFFVLIVVVPMLAVGFLVFRLISDGKCQRSRRGVAFTPWVYSMTQSVSTWS